MWTSLSKEMCHLWQEDLYPAPSVNVLASFGPSTSIVPSKYTVKNILKQWDLQEVLVTDSLHILYNNRRKTGSAITLTSCCCGHYEYRGCHVFLQQKEPGCLDEGTNCLYQYASSTVEGRIAMLIIYQGKCCPVAFTDRSGFKYWDT